MENTHVNESILSAEILEDQKKNRIDHMKYLKGMEDIGSEVLDKVVSEMEAYDYDKYNEADVRRALAHSERTPEDFQALLSPAALPLLEEIAQAAQVETRKHFGNSGSKGSAPSDCVPGAHGRSPGGGFFPDGRKERGLYRKTGGKGRIVLDGRNGAENSIVAGKL